MKLFQIEEPEGAPLESDGPGAAVGIDLGPGSAAIAIALGGNAEILPGVDGGRRLPCGAGDLTPTLLSLRSRAEKQLARPVTHAVIAADGESVAIEGAARGAGLTILRLIKRAEAARLGGSGEDAAALGAALRAEEDAPRVS